MIDHLKNMPDESAALHKQVDAYIKQGLGEEEIIASLQQEGIAGDYAVLIIDNVLTDMRNRKDFFKMLVMATFTTAGGAAINYWSYRFAENKNTSFYLLLWGIVVAGILMFLHAVSIYRKLPKY